MSPSGAVIMGVFAAVWWWVGITASANGSTLMYTVPLVMTGAVIATASLRRTGGARPSVAEDARRGRLVGYASGAEGIAIFVAVNVLANIRKLDFLAPTVAVIVGLHFVPLARWLPARSYYVTSALLVALGSVGFTIADANQRLLIVSIGAACVLWLTCAAVLREAR